MDVVLQLGAHRTGSTSLQSYLREQKNSLLRCGIGFWGPKRIREGVSQGVIPNALTLRAQPEFRRARGRIAWQVAQAERRGASILIASDENILGTMRQNLVQCRLYASVGDRVARYHCAFSGRVGAIHISLRCLSTYWPSALCFCLMRGFPVPGASQIGALVNQPRNWRDVLTDLAAAVPDVPIYVTTYEQFGARPERVVSYLTAQPLQAASKPIWRNRRPAVQDVLSLPLSRAERAQLVTQIRSDQWHLFTQHQISTLQERYADDLFWLRAGADGLAYLLEDTANAQTGQSATHQAANKGQNYDKRRHLARSR